MIYTERSYTKSIWTRKGRDHAAGYVARFGIAHFGRIWLLRGQHKVLKRAWQVAGTVGSLVAVRILRRGPPPTSFSLARRLASNAEVILDLRAYDGCGCIAPHKGGESERV